MYPQIHNQQSAADKASEDVDIDPDVHSAVIGAYHQDQADTPMDTDTAPLGIHYQCDSVNCLMELPVGNVNTGEIWMCIARYEP